LTTLFAMPEPVRTLRPYQTEAIGKLRQSLASGHRRPVLQCPTGGGKTLIAGEIIAMARAKDKRVAFVVPALSLIDQTVERLWSHGLGDVGVIQANHPMTDWSKPVQICSIQTLAKRGYPDAALVIVDECHVLHEAQKRWLDDPEWAKVPFIGLSATPWTKGLGKHYDDLIVLTTTGELIEQNFLSPFKVFAPAHPDLSGVKVTAGDYNEGQLGETMNRSALVADIVETWLKLGEGRPTICFCVDRAHAKHIQQQFEATGIRCGYIDAYTEPGDRKVVYKQLVNGDLQIVVNIGCLTVGVDWPEVSCIIMARPTKSQMLFVQILGRGLRTHKSKEDLLVLDHSDNHTRLGFVTDIHHSHLSDGKESGKAEPKSAPLPKECPQCAYLRPPRVAKCPNCGFKPEPKSSVEHEDGELVELAPKGRRVPRSADESMPGHIRIGAVHIELGAFYGMLKRYGREHGYREGWAANHYKNKTGNWPNGRRDAPEMDPIYEVHSWIRSRQIAFSRRKAKETPEHAHA
jgi:DNA repair protein RadD